MGKSLTSKLEVHFPSKSCLLGCSKCCFAICDGKTQECDLESFFVITLLVLKGLPLIALCVMGSKCLVNYTNYR